MKPNLFSLEVGTAAFTGGSTHITDVDVFETCAGVEDGLLVLRLVVVIDFNSNWSSLSYQSSSFSNDLYAFFCSTQL